MDSMKNMKKNNVIRGVNVDKKKQIFDIENS